jgi:hypothetical protein
MLIVVTTMLRYYQMLLPLVDPHQAASGRCHKPPNSVVTQIPQHQHGVGRLSPQKHIELFEQYERISGKK